MQVLDLQLFVDVFRSFEVMKPTDSLYWMASVVASVVHYTDVIFAPPEALKFLVGYSARAFCSAPARCLPSPTATATSSCSAGTTVGASVSSCADVSPSGLEGVFLRNLSGANSPDVTMESVRACTRFYGNGSSKKHGRVTGRIAREGGSGVD